MSATINLGGQIESLFQQYANLFMPVMEALYVAESPPEPVPKDSKTVSSLTSRAAVLEAVHECDELGRAAFLERYGYGPAIGYFLVHEGRRYDSKAIVGVAVGKQFPEHGPLRNNEFSGGLGSAVTKLRELGFEVIHETANAEPSPAIPTAPKAKQPKYSSIDFAAETKFSEQSINQWLARLRRKGQIILQGPPGTGKTFVAERLARTMVSETYGLWDIVQFHPSYAYEDFMQGIKPKAVSGALTYDIEPGRFLQFCARASEIDAPSVLIIDEINRANLSRVFGELMYLLEYREKSSPLASGGKPFRIPKNVYIIGTMNTADRSIALVDHAIRRRFSFVYLEPDYEVLQAHLAECGLPSEGLIKALKAINTAIDDRNYWVGVSYFLADGKQLSLSIRDIWLGEIEPYLEEYFYDRPDKVAAFRWDALLKKELADWA